jgi:hypothetical protein
VVLSCAAKAIRLVVVNGFVTSKPLHVAMDWQASMRTKLSIPLFFGSRPDFRYHAACEISSFHDAVWQSIILSQ